MQDVPKAVLSASQRAYPNAEARGWTRESSDGKTAYEVESVEGKIKRDILYDLDGNVLSIEESLNLNQLPDQVRVSLQKQYPIAKILKCEKIIKGSKVQYELLLKKGKETQEVVLESDGKVSKTEKK